MSLRLANSLRRKLVLLLTAVAAIAVVSSCACLVAYQWRRASQMLYSEAYTQANLVASNSSAALMFGDKKAASETLAMLRMDPRMQLACLYDRSGTIVASMQNTNNRTTCPARSEAISAFSFSRFHILHTVAINGEDVGSLYLDISQDEVHHMLVQSAKVSAATALAATLFALLLSTYMQRWVSRPIIDLSGIALRVSREGKYDIRASCSSSDEVGVLVTQFNEMLACIQQRDRDLRDSYDLLELKVQERTADLTAEIKERKLIETDLERARVVAEESSQAKSRFLANMSHELRTPLNAIIGYGEMLFEDATADKHTEVADDLEKILSSARHLRAIISDVLDLSKVEAGHMTLHMASISVNSLLNDVVATAEMLSRNNRNRFVVEPLRADEEVTVDPLRFRQCLLNLISNACKFTSNGEITVHARKVMSGSVASIVWAVRDTGAGIATTDLHKLFKNFSQVDNSATRKHGGTGLGLSISQELCHAMGGHITVESVVGEGSTFSIHIPLLSEEATKRDEVGVHPSSTVCDLVLSVR